jgi:hypothetical protein
MAACLGVANRKPDGELRVICRASQIHCASTRPLENAVDEALSVRRLKEGPEMQRVASVSGRILLALAVVLILLGILTWPPGGLMFALPFVFLIPGVFLALIGGLLLWVGNRPQAAERPELDHEPTINP